MLTVYIITSAEFSPLNRTYAKWIKHELQQTNRLWRHTDFHLNQKWNFRENEHQRFWFLIQLWLLLNFKVIQTDIKMYSLVVPITIPRFKQTGLQMSEYKSTWGFLFVFLTKSNKYGSLPWILNRCDKMSMKFIKLLNPNSRANSIKIHWKLGEIIGAEVFAFSHSCDLQSKSRSIRLVSKCRVG